MKMFFWIIPHMMSTFPHCPFCSFMLLLSSHCGILQGENPWGVAHWTYKTPEILGVYFPSQICCCFAIRGEWEERIVKPDILGPDAYWKINIWLEKGKVSSYRLKPHCVIYFCIWLWAKHPTKGKSRCKGHLLWAHLIFCIWLHCTPPFWTCYIFIWKLINLTAIHMTHRQVYGVHKLSATMYIHLCHT